ncbi:MAG: lysostaphin resistance A-like protein [Anaerolineae bacterium]
MAHSHLLGLALAFYGAMAAAAGAWGYFGDNPVLLWRPGRASLPLAGLGLLAGVAFGLLVVGSSRQLMRFGWAARLAHWFATVLGPLTWAQAGLMAGASALAEELLFRGAIQRSWGLSASTLLFALAHFPPERRLWPWTLWAGVMGLTFGVGTRLTGNLAFAITAHFVINLFNLRYLSRLEPAGDPHP